VSLAERGYGALKGQMVKKAALSRVFGFEIMPAPFVVAHLQVGLVLQQLGVTLDAEHERAGVYLTNALTGWATRQSFHFFLLGGGPALATLLPFQWSNI
jgi:hypothetical protein